MYLASCNGGQIRRSNGCKRRNVLTSHSHKHCTADTRDADLFCLPLCGMGRNIYQLLYVIFATRSQGLLYSATSPCDSKPAPRPVILRTKITSRFWPIKEVISLSWWYIQLWRSSCNWRPIQWLATHWRANRSHFYARICLLRGQ